MTCAVEPVSNVYTSVETCTKIDEKRTCAPEDHVWRQVKRLGRCYYLYECRACGTRITEDSSD